MTNPYNHPYHPYDVQISLMNAVYKTLKNGSKLGIFESPTGTGKTLSLICASMTWLRENQHIKSNTIVEEDGNESDDEPEWVKQAYLEKIKRETTGKIIDYENYLDGVEHDGGVIVIEQGKRGKVQIHKRRKNNGNKENEKLDESDILPVDYDNDEGRNGINDDVSKLLDEMDKKDIEIVDKKINNELKIYFVSRTHSQLHQFSNQLKLTNFPSSIKELKNERIKYLPLGSRKQLCINDKVKSLNDTLLINKQCIDLQKEKEVEKKCQFMINKQHDEDLLRLNKFEDLIMTKIYDIEDIVELGENLKCCPYYGVRGDILPSEIISMPYQTLLNKETREMLGIDLTNSVVIIDEAHNLNDSIISMYSSSLSKKSLERLRNSLKRYIKKFMLKMSSSNRIQITKLYKLVNILYKFIERCISLNNVQNGKFIERNEIFDETTDLLNVNELDEYLVKSRLAYKLETYMERSDETYKSKEPLLCEVKQFLYSLSNPQKNGRFFWDTSNNNGDVILKYLLLDSSEIFQDIVEESRCVLLAGGTMSPIDGVIKSLAPNLPNEKIDTFSCGHVIPKENLKTIVKSEYEGVKLRFTHEYRYNEEMVNKLGKLIIDTMMRVPKGFVLFFTSYSYLDKVIKIWERTGVLSKMKNIKEVFIDNGSENIFNEYRSSIELSDNAKGAILFSVLGGRLSEGINFSDDLARMVAIIGVPFADPRSAESIAKNQFGRNSPMEDALRRVNQAVGRAIRNISDYAAVMFIDERYAPNREGGSNGAFRYVSGWIRDGLANRENIEEFFRRHSVNSI